MTKLTTKLPSQVEIGAQRHEDWGTEIVPLDSGAEHRNNRWANPLRAYDVSFPLSKRDGSIYTQVVALWNEAKGNLHSFDFKDWATGQEIEVRFDGQFHTIGVTPELEHIVQVTLREVRSA